MEWIDANLEQPSSSWHIVLVTDGILVCLAKWIENPLDWYGPELMEWDENIQKYIELEKEWHNPHWLFETSIGPFIGNDECFGIMEDISHWMPLPLPPKKEDK